MSAARIDHTGRPLLSTIEAVKDAMVEKYAIPFQTVATKMFGEGYVNEFEYYLLSLELEDVNGNLVDRLIFPVMPESIQIVSNTTTSIKKSAGGAVVLSVNSFNPLDINIQGNFGRKLRILKGRDSNISPILGVDKLSMNVKTGYGVCKLLESMINKAQALDEDAIEPSYRLYLNNFAFNSNYLVEPLSLKYGQSQESNMIWNYSLQLKAVAPADTLKINGRSRNVSDTFSVASARVVDKKEEARKAKLKKWFTTSAPKFILLLKSGAVGFTNVQQKYGVQNGNKQQAKLGNIGAGIAKNINPDTTFR